MNSLKNITGNKFIASRKLNRRTGKFFNGGNFGRDTGKSCGIL
jgi:hypothetical protein